MKDGQLLIWRIAAGRLTRIQVVSILVKMAWSVELKESVLDDLRWFGRKTALQLLTTAEKRLSENPLADTRHLKSLRPNPVAQRELRLFGTYPILFNIDADAETVTIVLVGEKRGQSLYVRGEEFTEHHESDPAD